MIRDYAKKLQALQAAARVMRVEASRDNSPDGLRARNEARAHGLLLEAIEDDLELLARLLAERARARTGTHR